MAAKSGGAPPAKKHKTEDQKTQNDMTTYFKRLVDGKVVKATPEQIEQATLGLKMVKEGGLTKEQKMEFCECFKTNKGKGNSNWVKDFHATLQISKVENDRVMENYFTRTSES